MKSFSLFILLSFSLSVSEASAQKKFKDYLLTGSSMFVSGLIDGTVESITWHYDQGFKARFPHANDHYWNPSISWTNKYKNGCTAQGPKFPGSTTWFAFTTDGYHMLRTSQRALNVITLVDYLDRNVTRHMSRKKRIKSIVEDFLILTAIRSAGFTLAYDVVFKQNPNYHP